MFLTRTAVWLTSQFLLTTPCQLQMPLALFCPPWCSSCCSPPEGGKKKTFLRTTWPSPKVDECHLYRFRNQCVSVRLYSLGISLFCERESTPVLRQPGSLTPSNHSPAERNQSKVDVSTTLRWWMGLTREMMDDQGGHVCFISCRMSYYGNTAAPVTSGWPVSKREVSHDFGCLLNDRYRQAVQKHPHVWLRRDFWASIKNEFILSRCLGF